MSVQTAVADVGIALQSAKGAAAANPQYQFGVNGGQVAAVDIDQPVEDMTSSSRVKSHANRTGAVPGASWDTRAWWDQIGLILYAALGGYQVTGAGPYTHTVTPAGDLPYLTVWGSQDGEHYRLDDAKLGELKLSWDGNDPVKVTPTFLGLDLTPDVADPTPAADVICDLYLTPVNGTFKVDVDGATPVAASIKAGEITIDNGAVADILSGSILPDDIEVGALDLSVSLTVKTANVAEWREAVYGSAAGTTISQVVIYGSFEVIFTDLTNTLTITGSRVPFLCALPDADPSGGPGEIALEGMLLACPDDDAISCVLSNDVADYTA